MNQITYLIGAGASAQKLPVVNQMGQAILELINGASDIKSITAMNPGIKNAMDPIYNDLRWLAENCNSHSSIDTYAKKLYLNGSDDLNKLKFILSLYLTMAQKFKFKIDHYESSLMDKRYDNFWASILKQKGVLPKNIRVLSWNYDNQFEISYGYIFNKNTDEVYKELNMLSPTDIIEDYDVNSFSIYKLNGSARVLFEEIGLFSCLVDYKTDNFNFLSQIINIYKEASAADFKKGIYSELSFAWEKKEQHRRYFELLNNSILNSRTLVVIGYSFPFFNREIDKLIVSKRSNPFNKIYIQAPKEASQEIKERLQTFEYISSADIKIINGVDQFYFPPELDS